MRCPDSTGMACYEDWADSSSQQSIWMIEPMTEQSSPGRNRCSHWDNVYKTKQSNAVSWFEADPQTSLELIECFAPTGGSIIDVGGGASLLVDRLLETQVWHITVLDISATAIELTRARLGERANRVVWIRADITEASDLAQYDVWHDRAVLHFLTSPEDRDAYLNRLNASLKPGGFFILATFAPEGPQKCSDLDVCRYDAAQVHSILGDRFRLARNFEHLHSTPWGKSQLFTYAVFQKQ